jgi:hypothetical protein
MNRNLIYVLIALSTLFAACNQNKKDSELSDDENNPEAADVVDVSENQLLYNEVMKVHDQVMPKMDDLHRKKQELKKKITDTPGLTAEQKQGIEMRIAKIDSASEGMMVWMRKFNPLSDSDGEEKAREYLENEMEKVKKVREDILEALREAEEN